VLPDLYVIMITPYDPFGYDYMMYTVHNKCNEVPELEYPDGLTYIYFYTGGKKGGNNKEQKCAMTYSHGLKVSKTLHTFAARSQVA